MNTKKKEKSLGLIFAALFFLSASFLFWQNERELDPDLGKNWWTLSFTDLENSEDLSFTVENHSNSVSFTYEILSEKRMLSTGILSPKRGEQVTIHPEIPFPSDARVSIVVSDGIEKKEIYR